MTEKNKPRRGPKSWYALPKRNKQRNKLRSNPAAKMGLPGIQKFLSETAGNMMVTSVLTGATLDEKMIIAAFIPTVLGILRTVPKKDLSSVVVKLFPEEIVIAVDSPPDSV